jgi:hypothetical protein
MVVMPVGTVPANAAYPARNMGGSDPGGEVTP